MPPEELWPRYAAIWSKPEAERDAELSLCLSRDVSYLDPNGLRFGRAALSAYMGDFQAGMPGTGFRIDQVLHHHGRTLANWSLLGAGDTVVQTGTSFGELAEDGRLRVITGFFYPDADAP